MKRDRAGISRRSRYASIVAAGVAMALVTSACGGSSSGKSASSSGGSGGSGGKQTVSFLTHWGPDQVKMLQDAAATFAATDPNVSVKIQAVPFGNLLSTLRTQGASPDGPTIAGIYDLWLPQLVRDGLSAPAPASVASDVTSNWPKNLADDVTKEGKTFGYPNEVDLYQLNYNKSLFAAAGISAPPTTWDELFTDAQKLTKRSGGKTTQQGIGFITNWAAGMVHPFLSFAASNGGSLLSSPTTSALTSANTQATADFYQKLIDAKVTDPTMSAANANTTGPYLDNFVNGRTAMIVMANWWQGALKSSMGAKYTNVATAPIPVGPNGSGSSSISYSWLTMVNSKASQGKQDAAWKFLTWLNGPTSGKAGSSAMADILMSMGILPSRTSDIKAHQTELADPFLKSYVDSLSKATPFPTVVGGDAATEVLQKQLENLMFGKTSAASAMKSASSAVDAALAKANG